MVANNAALQSGQIHGCYHPSAYHYGPFTGRYVRLMPTGYHGTRAGLAAFLWTYDILPRIHSSTTPPYSSTEQIHAADEVLTDDCRIDFDSHYLPNDGVLAKIILDFGASRSFNNFYVRNSAARNYDKYIHSKMNNNRIE